MRVTIGLTDNEGSGASKLATIVLSRNAPNKNAGTASPRGKRKPRIYAITKNPMINMSLNAGSKKTIELVATMAHNQTCMSDRSALDATRSIIRTHTF